MSVLAIGRSKQASAIDVRALLIVRPLTALSMRKRHDRPESIPQHNTVAFLKRPVRINSLTASCC